MHEIFIQLKKTAIFNDFLSTWPKYLCKTHKLDKIAYSITLPALALRSMSSCVLCAHSNNLLGIFAKPTHTFYI